MGDSQSQTTSTVTTSQKWRLNNIRNCLRKSANRCVCCGCGCGYVCV